MTKTKASIWAGDCSAGLLALATVVAAVYSPSDPTFPIVYTAPESIEVGDVAVIDATATEADSYAYSVTPPAPCLLFEDGTKLVFGGKVPGEYVFVIAAAKGGQVAIAEHTITVEGGVPKPVPSSFALRLKRAISAIDDPGKAGNLAALAGNFRAVASMIAAGVITTPEDAIAATYNLNLEALGDAREAWAPVRDLISAELQSRPLPDMPSHTAAWREIVAILEECVEQSG